MNLIDLYGDPSRQQQPLPICTLPPQLHDTNVPFLLLSLRDRLRIIYPNDLLQIIPYGQAAGNPRLLGEHSLQYLQRRPYKGSFQFHYEISFSPAVNLLTIRGGYLMNGMFLRLEGKEELIMTVRAAANLNAGLSPLKLTVNMSLGEVSLEHSSFVDGNLADAKFKRNMVNLTYRVAYIVDLLMRNRLILLYYSKYRQELREEDVPQFARVAGRRMEAVEGMLREVCFGSYLEKQANKEGEERQGDKGKELVVDHSLRRQLMTDMVQHIQSGPKGVVSTMCHSPRPSTPSFTKLSSQSYDRAWLNTLVSKQDQKFDFRIRLQVQLLNDADWRREEVGGNGIVFSQMTKFAVVDAQHIRRHPQAVHTPYLQRLAKKIDRNLDRESKILHELQVISLLGAGGASHPNIPTFFIDPKRNQSCLLTMWEQNLSLQHYLKKHTVSMYHLVLLLEQAAKGLFFLHGRGIVHCDFKPGNLILCRRLLLRLIDFGEAYAYLGGQAGQQGQGRPGRTFPFAGPQLYTDEEITPALDVYSFGVTMHKCLFGNFMWGQGLLKTLRSKEGQEEVLPWILPEGLRGAGERRVAMVLGGLALRCIAYRPEERPLLPWVIDILKECRAYLAELNYR